MFYQHSCGCVCIKQTKNADKELLIQDCNGDIIFREVLTKDYPTHNRAVTLLDFDCINFSKELRKLVSDGKKFRTIKELMTNDSY